MDNMLGWMGCLHAQQRCGGTWVLKYVKGVGEGMFSYKENQREPVFKEESWFLRKLCGVKSIYTSKAIQQFCRTSGKSSVIAWLRALQRTGSTMSGAPWIRTFLWSQKRSTIVQSSLHRSDPHLVLDYWDPIIAKSCFWCLIIAVMRKPWGRQTNLYNADLLRFLQEME